MNPPEYFPYPIQVGEEGIVAIGVPLNTDSLLEAYSKGIFPWPQEGLPILWFCPAQRGVLFFDEFHVSESMKKTYRQKVNSGEWHFTLNTAFDQVIEACAQQPRLGQSGTWILPEMKAAYLQLFADDFVLSFEVWRGSELVGGLYGVLVGGVFSGESMFHKQDDASKAALIFAVEFLQEQGLHFIDTQMVTPLIANFGGREIDRDQYLRLVAQTQQGLAFE